MGTQPVAPGRGELPLLCTAGGPGPRRLGLGRGRALFGVRASSFLRGRQLSVLAEERGRQVSGGRPAGPGEHADGRHDAVGPGPGAAHARVGAQGTHHEGTPREEGVQRVASGPWTYIPVGFQHSEAKCAKQKKKRTRVSEPPRKGGLGTLGRRGVSKTDPLAAARTCLKEGALVTASAPGHPPLQLPQTQEGPSGGERPGQGTARGDTPAGGPTCPGSLPGPLCRSSTVQAPGTP